MSNWSNTMREDWDRRIRETGLRWIFWNSNQNPDAFFEEGKRQVRALASPVFQRLGFSPAGKRSLEIGCGIGRLFPGFSDLGFGEVWGVDISPEMVERGSRLCPVAQARFVQTDGQSLNPLEDSYFDYCFSYNVFGHIPDRTILWQYLAETWRVLRPGGVFQFHFRARHPLKGRALLLLPESLRDVARRGYHLASSGWLHRRRVRSISENYPPGDLKTWLGAAVDPRTVSRQLQALGFADVQTFPDPSYREAGAYFWAVGRKPGQQGPKAEEKDTDASVSRSGGIPKMVAGGRD